MKRFSEIALPGDGRKMFDCPQVSITEIVNCEIAVHDYIPDLKTAHGDGRMLILFEKDGRKAKFFTNCKAIKEAMVSVQENDLPFLATVKAQKAGSATVYKLS